MATAKMMMLLDLSNKLFNNKLVKTQKKFSKNVDKMRIKFRGIADEVPGLNRAFDLLKNPYVAIGAGIAGFAMAANKGVKAVEKFDSAFLPIKQLNLDKSQANLNAYRNQIRDAAFDIGTNLQESTQAMYDLQSATGLYGNDAIKVFKKVGEYSIATGADINDTMNSTTKAMKAFGLGVNDIDKLLESNAKTVQVGITTFDELAKVQTEYAGAASATGQSVDAANKVFAMFTSVAKNSDVGANMTKSFFDGLSQQKSKIQSELGIDLFSNGKTADNKGAYDIPLLKNSVIVADRFYNDFSLLNVWDKQLGIFRYSS